MFNPNDYTYPGTFRVLLHTQETGTFTAGRATVDTQRELENHIDGIHKRLRVNKYKDYNFVIKLETPDGLYPVRQTRGKSVATKRDMAVVYLDPATQRAKVNLYTDIPPWSLPKPRQEER